jgi:hypothetical protein
MTFASISPDPISEIHNTVRDFVFVGVTELIGDALLGLR